MRDEAIDFDARSAPPATLQADRLDASSLIPHPSSLRSNLPLQLTSFIGREREIAEATRLLGAARLVTLTGAGGCGKTRLALQVAEGLCVGGPAHPEGTETRPYPDGVWLVELASLSDPALVAQIVAAVLDVRGAPGRGVLDSLTDALQAKSLLLVLDNCEHVIEAAARLTDALLRRCPDLRILATSREPLGCAGEVTLRVPSLSLPPRGIKEQGPEATTHHSPLSSQLSEALPLFVDRAQAALPGFALTDDTARAVAEICYRLDGIPLAIELAAARVRVFSVEQIEARLDDRFRLLTGGQRTALPRQQTLRAAVEWSYLLLAEPERALLRRLSVFAGGWTFEAAEAAAAGDGIEAYAVLDLLAMLVDKSLVLAEVQRGAVRYRLLETIRAYAHEKLVESGEAKRTHERHVDYFVRLAEEADPRLRGPEQRAVQERLEAEIDNFRFALEWSLAARPERALSLSGALSWFWWVHSDYEEGRRWLGLALDGAAGPTAARVRALQGEAWLAHHQRDSAAARDLLAESLALARTLSDRRAEAWALHGLGRVTYFDGDPHQARTLGEQSLALAEETGDAWLIAWALHLLGLAAQIAGDFATARAYYTRSLTIREAIGDQEGIHILHWLLGFVAFREGNTAEAISRHRDALAIQRALGYRWQLAMSLAGFSGLAAGVGQPERAVRLAGASSVLSETYHMPPFPPGEALMTDGLARAREALDNAAYAAAWAEGRSLSLEESLAEALAVEPAPPTTPPLAAPPPANAHGLTPTERQILRLLARGHTTREIAAELVVAVSTVDRHLTHIYAKLGVRNRAEATASALQTGLV